METLLFYPPMTNKTPMITRVPVALRESLRQLSTDPKYGNLHKMHTILLKQFLDEKPYRQQSFAWSMPAKRGTTGWANTYNVVVPVELQERAKNEASALDVSLTTLLYSGLEWWNTRS